MLGGSSARLAEAGPWHGPCHLSRGREVAERARPMQEPGIPSALLECLEAVYRLQQEGGPPVTVDALRRRLGLGESAVLEKILALQGRGWLETDAPPRLRLTAEGERVAVGLVRRHRLLERFCTDLLGLAWDAVHEEACRLTPVLSDRVADGLARLLGDPATCPHGNPIPSAAGAVRVDAAVPLSRLGAGRHGVVVRIEREEGSTLRYLATLGLLPGTEVSVEEVAPFGGPVLARVGAARYALGRKVASKILVREA